MKKILLLALMAFALVLTACGGDDDKKDDKNGGPDYPYADYFNAEIMSTSVDGNKVVMTIEAGGHHPLDKLVIEVTFENGSMTAFEVKEHKETDTWGGAIIDAGAVQEALIADADDISSKTPEDYEEFDTTAGSTLTIEGMLDAAIAAVEHFNKYYK